MKCLILITVLACVFQLGCSAPAEEEIDCAKLDEVLDDLGGAQGITTLNDKYKLVTNADEFTKRCQEWGNAIKTLKKYNKVCLTSLTQQVLSAILRTRSQLNEASCKPGSQEFNAVVEASKCIQENALEAAKDAEKKTILSSQVILDANIADDKLRTRRSCCSVIASKGYFLNATKDKCAKHENIYSQYVDSYTSESMALICPSAQELQCDKLEQLKIEGVEPKSKFFLNPMVKLVKTLDH